ncbi:dehydrogenase [Spirochaetia bacterium]|nr:dehydrogenase [Spirochaetia bacterium]
MENALVLFETDAAFREKLTAALQDIKIIFNEGADTGRIDPAVLPDTTVIFGNPGAEFLKLCPRLKWLQLQTAGANGYVSGEIGPDTILTCATGGYGPGVSEHMMAMTLELFKKLHLYRDGQIKKSWCPRGIVKSVEGAVVLVVGLGDIGAGYARRMKALGAYVIGLRRTPHPKPEYVDELYLSDKLEELLPRADIVALIVPGTDATRGIIGRPQIGKMKRGAVIINAGRGSAIDTEALCDALESGALDGAGLDVTDPEPLPPDHRLWTLENAVITPHIAGGRHMIETGRLVMELNLENTFRFIKGQPLKSRVDLKTGYRIPE